MMPATMPALPASDLRSEAKSYQRDKNQNAKWAKGFAPRSGIKCTHLPPFQSGCSECPSKPANFDHNAAAAKAKKRIHKKLNGQASTLARKAFRNDVDDANDGPVANVTDTSSDDEVHDASAAPLPAEADFMYSYDSRTGPATGHDILSGALTKAVQRFENTQTEKLIRKEYDVIDHAYAADDDEDDYEMIEHAHLK